MPKHALIPLALAILLAPPAAAKVVEGTAEIEAEELRGHVRTLASDEYEGRRPGTPGGEKAAAYIAERFAEIGLEPAGDDVFGELERAARLFRELCG